jgi:hypothetical protein
MLVTLIANVELQRPNLMISSKLRTCLCLEDYVDMVLGHEKITWSWEFVFIWGNMVEGEA